MKQKLLLKTMLLLCALIVGSSSAWATDVTYTVSSRTEVTTSGTAPAGSSATFVNTYNPSTAAPAQMTGGNSQTLTLSGYNGYNITNITLSMRSNTSGGSGKLSYSTDGGTTFTYIVGSSTTTVGFNKDGWHGSWSTSFVNISKDVNIKCSLSNLIIKIEATANSLFCQSYKLTYSSFDATTDPTITFNNGSVNVGQTLNLSTLFTSNSDAPAVYSITTGGDKASLDGSTLTGVAVGSVTVQASQARSGIYRAATQTATITVNAAKELSSIAITTPPTKITYEPGELFDPTGMVVTATYSDASTDDVTASCTYSPNVALTLSDDEITISYTEGGTNKTTTQAIKVTDCVELPFAWAGGSSSNLTAIIGITASGLGSDYADNDTNRPYLVKFDTNNDFILIKTDGQPGRVEVDVKMLGGGNTSKITVQGSSDGSSFHDVEVLTISGSQNDVLYLKTTKAFVTTDRYVKLLFTKGSNVGVGPISIAEYADKTVTVTSAGWASYSTDMALDFEGTGVTAYIAKAKDDTHVTLTEITKVPANTGIVVNGSATTHNIPVLSGAADDTEGNLLKPWLTAGTPSDAKYYILSVDGDNNPIFKKSKGGTLAAGKSYLVMSANTEAPQLSVDFGEGTTNLEAIRTQMEEAREGIFDLSGRRVENPTKGLYIVNGKKVIIK